MEAVSLSPKTLIHLAPKIRLIIRYVLLEGSGLRLPRCDTYTLFFTPTLVFMVASLRYV